MNKIKKRKKVYLSSILSLLFIIFFNFKVQAKELSISNLEINSKLMENGSLHIEENIDFKMDGDFNGVYRDINTKFSDGVENIVVKKITSSDELELKKVDEASNGQDGVYELLKSGEIYKIKIYAPSKNENKKFKISYDIKNVATKYEDIGELHYRFWGDQSDTTINKFNINLIIDKPVSENTLRVFSRGPVDDMKLKIVNFNTFNIQGRNVKTKTPIEGRFLFPKEEIALSNKIVKKSVLNSIIQEENSYQRTAKNSKRHGDLMKSVGNSVAYVFCFMNVIFLIYMFKISSRKKEYYNRNDFPEDCTPAIASMLCDEKVQSKDITATLLDLVRKEYLILKQIKTLNYSITKIKKTDSQLLEHEKFIMKWFLDDIGDGLSVEWKDIKKYIKKSEKEFLHSYYDWKSLLKADFEKKGYCDKIGRIIMRAVIIISIIQIITMLAFLNYGSRVSILGLSTAICVAICSFAMRNKKSEYGEEQFIKWQQFKDYVEDREFIKNMDLESVETIDKYVVYSIALEVNKKIFDNLNIRIKNKIKVEENYYDSCICWYAFFDTDTLDSIIDKPYSGDSSSDSSYSASGDSGSCSGGGDAGGF